MFIVYLLIIDYLLILMSPIRATTKKLTNIQFTLKALWFDINVNNTTLSDLKVKGQKGLKILCMRDKYFQLIPWVYLLQG